MTLTTLCILALLATTGKVDVRALHEEQWEWWMVTGNSHEERKKAKE
jgi:hypothetical protein